MPSLFSSLASSGSRRWLFWVSPSLMGLALGHTWTKCAAKPENACSGIRVLVAHGQRLFDVVRAIVYPRTATLCLLYLAGICHCTVGERKRLNGILRKLTRSGLLPADYHSFDKQVAYCSRAYSTLFRSILLNVCHVQFIHIIKSHFHRSRCFRYFISKSSVKNLR